MKMLGRAKALDNAISEDFNRLIVMCSRSVFIFHFAFLFYFILFLLFLTCHMALSGKLKREGVSRSLPKTAESLRLDSDTRMVRGIVGCTCFVPVERCLMFNILTNKRRSDLVSCSFPYIYGIISFLRLTAVSRRQGDDINEV